MSGLGGSKSTDPDNFQPANCSSQFISAEQASNVMSKPCPPYPSSVPVAGSGVCFMPAAKPYDHQNESPSTFIHSDEQPIVQETSSYEGTENFVFSDKTIRHGFVRKVYSILMCQLVVTASFIATFVYVEEIKGFVQQNPVFFPVTFIIMFVMLILMSCCTELRRRTPVNYILLALFTVAESLLLGCVAMKYDPVAVLMAAGVCAAVCLGLTMFAMQTKWDFTVLGGSLFAVLLVLIVFGIIAIIFPSRVMLLLYSAFGAILFSVYLIYDTQLMLGGKHKYSISPEEYIFAALNLYVDVINIFLYVLAIIGLGRK
ncbi:protein lifeguard 1-like [Schistocerca cancellata]|uniref:protein lifeguard 1-like n=1 Tax=Schistocerca cancellata TaxID=274614 RepID=UPI0021189278|nr:protein lifeguard 1-like [Schistocerca cancellata]